MSAAWIQSLCPNSMHKPGIYHNPGILAVALIFLIAKSCREKVGTIRGCMQPEHWGAPFFGLTLAGILLPHCQQVSES